MKNQRKHLFKNQFGFSMVEVLVAGAITTVIGMGVVSTTVNSMKAAKNVDQKSEVNDASASVNMAMLDNRSCGAFLNNNLSSHNFTGANFGTRTLNAIQLCDPVNGTSCSNVLQLNQTLGSGVQATGIRLVAPVSAVSLGTISITSPPWGGPGVIGYEKYQAQLEIDFTKTAVGASSSVGAAQFRTITKGMIILVNPTTDRVELCYGMDSPEAACRDHLGGEYDSAKTPSCQISNVAINSDGLYLSDITNWNMYSSILGEANNTGGRSGTNMALTGTRPGISYGPMSGAAMTDAYPVNSGAAVSYYDSATGRFRVMPRPSGGTLELNAPAGNVEIMAGGAMVVQVPQAGNVRMLRSLDMNANWVVNQSDRRLKTDIKPLTNSLEKILALNGKSYRYTADINRKKQVGFIAQEVQSIVPEAVVTTDDGKLGVIYTYFIAYLADAIKELKELFDSKSAEQDAKIALLQEQVQQLVQRVESCEQKSK